MTKITTGGSKEPKDKMLQKKHSVVPVILLNGQYHVMDDEPLEWQTESSNHEKNMQMGCFQTLPSTAIASCGTAPPSGLPGQCSATSDSGSDDSLQHSETPLPVWTKMYYNRASACIAETARRSSVRWSKMFEDDVLGEKQNVAGTAAAEAVPRLPRYSIEPELVLDFSCAGPTRPVVAHQNSTSNHSNRTRKAIWQMQDKIDFGQPPGYREKSSMLLEPNETTKEARLMRSLILIFAFGFLFPPIWMLGLLLPVPRTQDKVTGPGAGERCIVERVRRWKFACAIMLGMSVIFLLLCIGVIYKL